MDASILNPFVEATVNVIKTMAQTNPTPDKAFVKKDNLSWGNVTGIIGIAGPKVSGNLVISFDEPCILDIVSKMLMETFTSITPDVVDAVGEITNMISGGTKSTLSKEGFSFEMATPLMITGQNVELKQLAKSPIIVVPFKTEAGKFVLEVNLAPKGSN